MRPQPEPFFSIIIPTYERPEALACCLESLARLDYPRDRFEVVVVDDGSAAPPEALLAAFGERLGASLLAQPNAGPAAARNLGAARARGQFLAFLDDDCTSAPGWLRALAGRFETAPEAAVGGRTLNALPGNRYSTASQLLVDYLYAYHNAEPDRAGFVASNNLALPRSGFEAIGGFDARFRLAAAEDRDLCDRWLSRGWPMTYAPEAVIYHAHRLSLRGFWRQQFGYGRGAHSLRRLRAQRGQGRPGGEPASFYLRLLRYPLSRSRGRAALALTTLLFLSQAAVAAGFFWEAVHRRWASNSV